MRETGSAWISGWLSYASSSRSPPAPLLGPLPGNPPSHTSLVSKRPDLKIENPCSPCSCFQVSRPLWTSVSDQCRSGTVPEGPHCGPVSRVLRANGKVTFTIIPCPTFDSTTGRKRTKPVVDVLCRMSLGIVSCIISYKKNVLFCMC